MDDLGYGDVSSYGVGNLSTPNIDRISENGIVLLTDIQLQRHAHPVDMQFSLENTLEKSKARILPGNAPLLFDLSKETLPSLLKKANYKTAIIGKWHLGLGDENLAGINRYLQDLMI